jgi:hypothetical protein
MIQVAQPLFGEAMLRSAGLPNDDAMRERFQAWLLTVFEELLQPKVTRKKAGFMKSGSSAPRRGRVGRVAR